MAFEMFVIVKMVARFHRLLEMKMEFSSSSYLSQPSENKLNFPL